MRSNLQYFLLEQYVLLQAHCLRVKSIFQVYQWNVAGICFLPINLRVGSSQIDKYVNCS